MEIPDNLVMNPYIASLDKDHLFGETLIPSEDGQAITELWFKEECFHIEAVPQKQLCQQTLNILT